jgi:dTDP-4-dehydrorhamnose reductase
MKILLLGRDGQIGWELQRALSVLGEVVALGTNSTRNSGGLCGDLTQLDGLARTIRTINPAVIINAAAYTAVDKAQSEPDLAHTVNALAPAVLASEANALDAWLVHYSTDYVFDGSGHTPWTEEDGPNPLSVYGQSKWDGDQAVTGTPKHLIFRTSWVYSARRLNFVHTMLKLAKERDTLSVIDDQHGAPTAAELLADTTAHALRTALIQPKVAGLYHCAAAGATTWHGYAQHVIEHATTLGWQFKVSADQVRAIPSTGYPSAAKRPLNSRLDTSKLQATFGLAMPPWQFGVNRVLAETPIPA